MITGMLAWAAPEVLAQAQTQRPGDSMRRPGQPAQPAQQRESTPQRQEDRRELWKNTTNTVEASRLKGTRVQVNGKDQGEIDNVLIDPQSGKVTHVVIGRGGFAGIGEQKVVVEWDKLKLSRKPDGNGMIASIEQSALAQAARYEGTRARGETPAASPATGPAGQK
jgi:sporulation protein YlmC with PRC-barrel domain